MKGRVTKNKLIKWINERFISLELYDIKAVSISQPHRASDQIEGGCYRLYIQWESKTSNGFFHSYYSISEIQKHLDSGYELYLKFDRYIIYNSIELDLRKK